MSEISADKKPLYTESGFFLFRRRRKLAPIASREDPGPPYNRCACGNRPHWPIKFWGFPKRAAIFDAVWVSPNLGEKTGHESCRISGGAQLFNTRIGQIYNGPFLRGVFWLIITLGLWIGAGGLLGWICQIVALYAAY